jgi:hypothetical protein
VSFARADSRHRESGGDCNHDPRIAMIQLLRLGSE